MWQLYEVKTVTDRPARSLAKAVSYRMVSSVVTGVIFFGATQKARLALGVALIDSVAKIFVFYLHERSWTKIGFARGSYSREEMDTKEALHGQGREIVREPLEEPILFANRVAKYGSPLTVSTMNDSTRMNGKGFRIVSRNGFLFRRLRPYHSSIFRLRLGQADFDECPCRTRK